MNNDLRKKQITLVGLALGAIIVFSFGFSNAKGEIARVQEKYTQAYKDLIKLEEQQKQAARLEKELNANAQEIAKIKNALIDQTYENKLKIVIDLEDAAKSAGVSYDLSIVKELTKESITEEKARQARTRRKSQKVSEEVNVEQFPSVVLRIKVSGGYPLIIGFLDRLYALPYYMDMGIFSIISKREGGVEATFDLTVFTR